MVVYGKGSGWSQKRVPVNLFQAIKNKALGGLLNSKY